VESDRKDGARLPRSGCAPFGHAAANLVGSQIEGVKPMKSYVSVTIFESLCFLLRRACHRVSKQALRGSGPVADFEQIRRLLESLPLASGEHSVAVNRLTNAQHYLRSGEHGAARYELHLLLRSLEAGRGDGLFGVCGSHQESLS
jgi:hypothetical protein